LTFGGCFDSLYRAFKSLFYLWQKHQLKQEQQRSPSFQLGLQTVALDVDAEEHL